MSLRATNRVIGIVDYQAGNIQSLENAFEHLGARAVRLHAESEFERCTHLVLPGVGAFGFCAERLRRSGMSRRLHSWAFEEHRPLLGICVGMQLMALSSEEQSDEPGLDWMGGQVCKLPVDVVDVRVPHVGWNKVVFSERFGEFAADTNADFYFDHSYAYHSPDKGRVIGHCRHGVDFCAIVRRENITAAQFHPEKSQTAGMSFLRSFLAE